MWCEASLEVRGKSTHSYSNEASEYLVPPQLVDLPGGSLGGRASFEVSKASGHTVIPSSSSASCLWLGTGALPSAPATVPAVMNFLLFLRQDPTM